MTCTVEEKNDGFVLKEGIWCQSFLWSITSGTSCYPYPSIWNIHPPIYQACANVPGLKLSAKVKHGDTAAYAASAFSWNVILLLRPPGINLRCLMYTWRHPKRIIMNSTQRPMVWLSCFVFVKRQWLHGVHRSLGFGVEKFLGFSDCLLRCTFFDFRIINTLLFISCPR